MKHAASTVALAVLWLLHMPYMAKMVQECLNVALFCDVQEVVVCKDNDKLRLLEDNLAQCGDKRVIVFVNTKTHCDVVSRHLDHLSYRCTVLHGGKTQVHSLSHMSRLSSVALPSPEVKATVHVTSFNGCDIIITTPFSCQRRQGEVADKLRAQYVYRPPPGPIAVLQGYIAHFNAAGKHLCC